MTVLSQQLRLRKEEFYTFVAMKPEQVSEGIHGFEVQ